MEMKTYPKVKNAYALCGKRLVVVFDNGETKIYDCSRLVEDDAFALLKNETMFRSVRVDPFGYGVIWNDEMDLAESELWINGQTTASTD